MTTPRSRKILQQLRRLGPYLAVALVLPGGFLLVLALWFIRNKQRKA